MSNVKMFCDALPNIPWQEKPADVTAPTSIWYAARTASTGPLTRTRSPLSTKRASRLCRCTPTIPVW